MWMACTREVSCRGSVAKADQIGSCLKLEWEQLFNTKLFITGDNVHVLILPSNMNEALEDVMMAMAHATTASHEMMQNTMQERCLSNCFEAFDFLQCMYVFEPGSMPCEAENCRQRNYLGSRDIERRMLAMQKQICDSRRCHCNLLIFKEWMKEAVKVHKTLSGATKDEIEADTLGSDPSDDEPPPLVTHKFDKVGQPVWCKKDYDGIYLHCLVSVMMECGGRGLGMEQSRRDSAICFDFKRSTCNDGRERGSAAWKSKASTGLHDLHQDTLRDCVLIQRQGRKAKTDSIGCHGQPIVLYKKLLQKYESLFSRTLRVVGHHI